LIASKQSFGLSLFSMKRFTTFNYGLDLRAGESDRNWQYAGASRFSFNQGLRFVKEALEQKKANDVVKVPWSDFDLINAFNKWKNTSAAGVDENGKPGLTWQKSICAQVFEEALVDASKGLRAFSDSKKGKRKGKTIAFPKPKKKHKCRPSFRFRNKVAKNGAASIRIENRTIRLPKLGVLKIHDNTRDLRRLLKRGGRILFATVHFEGNRWRVSINVEAGPLHPTQLHQRQTRAVGLDRGLSAFVVAADEYANEVDRVIAPKPLNKALKILRRKNRSLSRKKKFSKNWIHSKQSLNKTHATIKNIRRDFLQKLSTRLVKNHDHLVIESLNITGMIKNRRLSRHIADASWGEFARMLEYKAAWHGTKLEKADRFFPSTRTCSQCCKKNDALALAERVFRCKFCGFTADRDVNAGACLANFLKISLAAAKHSEALNACGEESSGLMKMSSSGETVLDEAGTLKKLRGTREGWWRHHLDVNTL
jgi:putative transposase